VACLNNQDFFVNKGATFYATIRWATEELVSVPITAITNAAPALVTAPAHGVPDGWPVAVCAVEGMYQVNAVNYPPRGKDWTPATVRGVDTVELNRLSSANWTPYRSGGSLVYNKPVVLDGIAAVFSVFDNPDFDGPALISLTNNAGVVVDPVGSTITPLLQTEGLLWDTGYYELACTDANGIITRVLTGAININ
jgi:hypothetical protein